MPEPTTVTGYESYRETAAGVEPGARVPIEVRVDVTDPYEAYRRARSDTGGVYLETSGGRDGWGYFGVRPESWLAVDEADVAAGVASFDALDERLAEESLVRGSCDVPYPCGAFGWVSYDVARELEDLPETTVDDRNLPRLQFGIYDRVAAWREPRGSEVTLRITSCPRIEGSESPRETYRRGLADALELADAALHGDPSPPDERASGAATFRNEVGEEEYASRVRDVKGYVRDGDTFQVNVSQRLVAPSSVHPVSIFDALRALNPAPYSALLEFPGVDLVSTSPELLLDCADGRLVTEPIAGTRPRGATASEDERLERELLADEKEHAEHAMLVDLERNDIGKVCEYGSVEVTDYRRVDRYSEVMHTVSVVVGRLRADVSLAEAIAAVFPGGTITGAPKPRTMEIIDEVERTRRGPYTGSIGVVGFDERATLNMTIRTLVGCDGRYYLRVGAGIVHDSDPKREYEETLDKGRALVNAVDEALGTDHDLDLVVDGEAPE